MKKLAITLGVILFAFPAIATDVNVYYFWQAPRCATCKKMEAYTESAVKKMNKSDVWFQSRDLSKPENMNAVAKYNLYTKSVIVSKNNNGTEEWKNLDGIWTRIGNQVDFENYIQSEIKQFQGVK